MSKSRTVQFSGLIGALALLASACGGHSSSGGTGGRSHSVHTTDAGTDAASPSGAGGSTGHGGSSSGGSGSGNRDAGSGLPNAHVRIASIVPDPNSFDAFGEDASYKPIPAAQNIRYGTVSDYFNVGVNPLTDAPSFVILPNGEMPNRNNPSWLNIGPAPDRARIDVTDITANQYASLILAPTSDGTNLEYETLDESALQPGAAGKAHLHVAWRLFDLGGSFVPTLAVVGQPCLTTDSVAVSDALSVAPGSFELGIYDRQNVSDCTELMGSVPITAAANDDVLVVVYHVGTQLRFMTAPIPRQ